MINPLGESAEDFSLPLMQQGGKKVMFYGAISGLGKVYLTSLEGKIDSEVFAEFLQNDALPAIRKQHKATFVLMQDNAPSHKGHTKGVIEEEKIEVMEWPPQSPDLNPMEQVWLWMATDIKTKTFLNIKELEEYVYLLWEKLSKNTILSYIQKLQDKITWVLENDGDLCPDHL